MLVALDFKVLMLSSLDGYAGEIIVSSPGLDIMRGVSTYLHHSLAPLVLGLWSVRLRVLVVMLEI